MTARRTRPLNRVGGFCFLGQAMAKQSHPFAGRKGSAIRDRFAANLYRGQNGMCRMCRSPIPASLRGKTGKRAAVVDHIIPYVLRPDLTYTQSNLQLICRGCHAICDGIEKTIADPDLIAEAKARVGQDW